MIGSMSYLQIRLKTLLSFLLLSFASLSMSAKEKLYVKEGGTGDGSSWSKAIGNIQQAVDMAALNGADVWVAKGVYKGDSLAVVSLRPNVNLYGGFAGNETSLAMRDASKNPTVLDGEGKMQVVYQNTAFADSSAVVVDGFTIQNGYAKIGGGAYLSANTTLNNCVIKRCVASNKGLAIYSEGANITNSLICENNVDENDNSYCTGMLYFVGGVIDNCIVKNNNTRYSSGLWADKSTINNSLFDGNFANASYWIDLNECSVSDCRFVNNNNSISIDNGTVFIRCLIDGVTTINSLLFISRGSVISNSQLTNCKSSSDLIKCFNRSKIINSTITDNESARTVLHLDTYPQILNSIIVGNKVTNYYTHYRLGDAIVKYTMIEGGASGEGNFDGNKLTASFVNPSKGDYSLSENSLCINAGTDVADTLDLLRNSRKQNGAVDMGAIESSFNKKSDVGQILYVKSGSNGSGSSWNDAIGELQHAISIASSTGKKHQIWVAKGTYYGDTSLISAISLAPGVSLYGGFDGTEESLNERDIDKNLTIIDGRSQRRCIIQNYDFSDSMSVVVDGFTIQNGYISDEGAILKVKKNSVFSNCIFTHAAKSSEAVYAKYSKILKCKFIDNSIDEIKIDNGIVDSCSFEGRSSAKNSFGHLNESKMSNSLVSGYSSRYSFIQAKNKSSISNCKIFDNEIQSGDVIYLFGKSSLENSLVYGNKTDYSGSIIWFEYNSYISNSTIAHNTTENNYIVRGTPPIDNYVDTITNSIIYGNKITDKLLPQVSPSSYLKVLYCASDGDLTGTHNIKLDSENSGSDTSKNYVCFINADGGDYRLHPTSSCIDNGLDSLSSATLDINGNPRFYGKSVDLGAFEYNGEFIQILNYGQTVCNNQKTHEATFDSTIIRIVWKVVDSRNVNGFEGTSGSGTFIPSMQLYTSRNNIDTLTLLVTPYYKNDVLGTPFYYHYYVYPDLSKQKVTFVNPKAAYWVNTMNKKMTIEWNKLNLPVEIDKYDFYLWKSSQKMPSVPYSSYLKDNSEYLKDLDNHTTYKYMVKAIVACDTICSDIDSFRIDIPVSLEVDGSYTCELGTKLNTSTYTTKYIKGFELNDTIIYSISGKDSADFSVVYTDTWNALTGGYFNVYYTPTDSKKFSSSATLTFKSGSKMAVLNLKGLLANYYVYNVDLEKDVYKAGDTVTIKGYVTDAYGNPYENKRLRISIKKNGSLIKTFDEISNVDGQVVAKYVSSEFESGVYTVGICLSGENTNETFAGFDIPGISCDILSNKWLVQKGDTIYGSINVRNHSNVDAHNVKVKSMMLANGCKVVFDSLAVLKGLSSENVKYYVIGESVTEGEKYLVSSFRVETEEGLTSDFNSYFYCETPYGQIKVLPANINEYVSKQKPKFVDLLLCNTGIGETGKVSISLPANFEGMTIPSGTVINNIKPGDTLKVTLKLAYYDGAKLNTPICGTIGFNCENGESTFINYSMEYTSSMVGSATIDVVDEYYYNSSSKSHLAGARVEIKNAFNSNVVASGTTDSTGKIHFDSIPEGDYLLAVTAEKHSNYRENISIQAGQNLDKLVFVSYQAVTYTWNVERVEIEDKYDIELETEYETSVPVPVVTGSFPNGLPSKESLNPGDKVVAYLLISNHGMIAAKNVTLKSTQMKHYKFTPEISQIDSLPANYSLMIPVVIERTDTIPSVVPDTIPDPIIDQNHDDSQDPFTQQGSGVPGIVVPGTTNPGTTNPGTTNPGVTTPVIPNPGVGNDKDKDKDQDEENEDDEILDDKKEVDQDCHLIVGAYVYLCGKSFIEKEFTVATWKCHSSSFTFGGISGDGGIGGVVPHPDDSGDGSSGDDVHYVHKDVHNFGGDFHIGISINLPILCDFRCLPSLKEVASCGLDLIPFIPGLGKLKDGKQETLRITKAKKKTIENVVSETYVNCYNSEVDLFGDSLSNGISPRAVVSDMYQIVTEYFGFIPGLDNLPFNCFDMICHAFSCSINGKEAKNCGEFIYDMIIKDESLRSSKVNFYESADPFLLASHDICEYTKFEIYRNRYIAECIGADESILKKTGLKDYLDVVWDSIAYRKKIDVQIIKKIPVSDLSLTDMIRFSERWNKTLDAWNNGVYASNEDYPNIANKSVLDKNLYGITNFYQYVVFRGFDDVVDLVSFTNEQMRKFNNKRQGVCANVKLQISQTMTMTREAFDGTLTVKNGKESDMDAFKVMLEIRDEKGNLANDLFQINTKSLTGIEDVDGNSSIDAGNEAKAMFRFIPERGAAPTVPVNYSFGGKIIYVEDGDTITIDLEPVALTVNPSPYLQLDYFMQRNILGDDALTEDRVEPVVPAALGVRIDNQGYGVAKNVKLETAQPEIVDNVKGLLVDFAIIGSSLDGKDSDLGSVNIDFGNIEAQTAKTGVWWMTSSLLGHFTKYEASVVHANSFGNPELSLVKDVTIHELIKTVDAYCINNDHVVDFLVNDDNDLYDIPDAIYYSNGGKDTVVNAKKSSLDKEKLTTADAVVKLTVLPSQKGWTYAQMNDPGENSYEIKKVVRVKDKIEIPLENVWTTFVTLPDGGDPIYENRLHFLDFMSTVEQSDYEIYYSMKKNLLEVKEISGMPKYDTVATNPVENVIVKFNRKIQNKSFDYRDIVLYCQAGDNLSDSTITVKQIDDYSYSVNISSKTNKTGYYKLEVNVNDIYDQDGYPGEFGMNATWSQFIEDKQDDEYKDDEITPITDVINDDVVVYSYHNSIYVKSTKSGSFDIYDIVSRLIVKDAKYGLGISHVATLPSGVYIVNGKKVIIK